MQITDKDVQTFRERAKTELQSNGAVGRLAWDAVVNALCNEVEELRKNAAISNAVDSAWTDVCAACAEGTPPERCAYYGDPDGCNAPTLGKHPEGDLAERLQDELEKAERRIAELERALCNASALRKALIRAKRDHWFNMTPELRDEIYDVLTSELPSNTVSMRTALQSVNRTMDIEVRINCTEKGELGKFGNSQSELCKRCRARNCECWQMTLKREVESALAAPARNCDRFADELDAQLAFLNDVWLISVDKNTMIEKDKFENWTEQMKTRYGRWLLAPAEGKEASND